MVSETMRFWETIYSIWGTAFYVISIATIIVSIWTIVCISRNKHCKIVDMKVNPCIFLWIGVLITLVGFMFSDSKLSEMRVQQAKSEHQITSYEQGISEMSDGNWHDAAIQFYYAGDYENSEILRDYCYYIYLSDAHPNWVPWMGISEITEG